MTPAEAIQIAIDAYPLGPERIAELLGAQVRYRALGVDGWCIRGPAKIIIRLDTSVTETRQRFTLAHELAHIIYGTKTEIVERGFDYYSSRSPAEIQANTLAPQLLLPLQKVQKHISVPLVDAALIHRIGTEATVSERVVALRLANLSRELGIGVAGVAAIKGKIVEWKKLNQLPLNDSDILRFHTKACATSNRLHREDGRHGKVYVASALKNPTYPTLFVQELRRDETLSQSSATQLKNQGSELFAGDERFRASLEGKFGAFKPTAQGMSLTQAVSAFIERYCDKWASEEHRDKFNSSRCRRFIRLKLSQWFTD